MAERISRAEYAKRRGVSRSAVTKAVRSGRITLIDGQWIDPVAADAQWAHHTDPTQSLRASRGRVDAPAAPPNAAPAPSPAPFDSRGLLEAKRRREDAQAAIAELELAEKTGRLVDVEQLRPMYADMVSAFKTALLARDDKLRDELHQVYGIEVDLALLNRHTTDALHELSRYDPTSKSFTHDA